MLSAKDRDFYRRLNELHKTFGLAPPLNVVNYRAMFVPTDAMMNAEPMPVIGAYHPRVEINADVATAVAVPEGQGDFPVLIHCHGNGGLAGSSESYRRFSYDCAARGFLTFMVDYRLAPENPFPAGFDDMITALAWVAEHAGEFGGNSSDFCMSGNSTGAGLAFSVARAWAERGAAPKLRGLVGIDGRYDRIADRTPGMDWMLEAYLGPDYEARVRDPRVSPGQELAAGLLPKVLIIGGSADHVAPSTVSFARTLLDAKIPFQMNIFEGTRHDFMRWPDLEAAQEGFEVMFAFLRACLLTA